MEQRRSGRDQDWTDDEAEGQPILDQQPPGIDSQTASEGIYPPRDHPVASYDPDVTVAGQAVPETVAERSKRERPDVPQHPPGDPGGRLVDRDAEGGRGEPQAVGEWENDDAALAAEEDAVHLQAE